MLSINTEKKATSLVFTLGGRIDASCAKDLETQCLEWIEKGEKPVSYTHLRAHET